VQIEESGPQSAAPPVSLDNNVQSSDVEKIAVPVILPQKREPEMSQPRRTRWTVWKEKVQTFIKKLFG